ncbi:sulfur carrier protein ThiS adenylyltransferase [Alkalithermobacter thermoalcaliphilus JW-YL-7 = DSM 7308]|uniref:Sulfur carrier protein ThiS adenylyltransferase n=1 Tax=Alkalithermobacter thermoalcaliphilus JW-YL-7 = DSM 7308 TaxID=1121328 RepID=A0A150FNV8_CLOPD|nr:thiamine biosynthesis protein ThiF [[Clostridium] paradoxum JW-YL-7 = DSM 7308]SHK55806.1 sulfur carrier protein ThiS adenylyltransferase [[Clostridium] paradoxum JW-YL-7 = DSM 7308]
MNIYVNENIYSFEHEVTAFEVRDAIKKDADIIIFNGFIIKEDIALKDNDKIVLIKRGEIPTKQELEYLLVSRHSPEVHEKIKNAKVAIAGLGGLGSNVAVLLARMGIGKLVLVDYDVVEPSNLNRQQYFLKHIGMRKTDALAQIIADINPFVTVQTKNVFVERDNIKFIFSDVDVIVEAFDNPKSKATLVNEVLIQMSSKKIVASSGVGGYFSSNLIKTKRVTENFYLVGDGFSQARPGLGLMAPRVSIAASHQANMVIRILLSQDEA